MTAEELDRYMRLHYPSVHNVALCYCKNPSDADDIAQDVFLALYTYSGEFGGEEHIKAWLLRCTVNKSINVLRAHRRRSALPLEAAEGRDSRAYSTDDGGELLETVMKLDKNSRTVLYLYYYEELKVNEIASVLGISEAAVRSRLLRARKRLKKLLISERNL